MRFRLATPHRIARLSSPNWTPTYPIELDWSHPLTKRLQSAYIFGSSRPWLDYAKFNIAASPVSPAAITGSKFGGVLNLNGVTGFVDIGNATVNTPPFTIVARIFPTGGHGGSILGTAHGAGTVNFYVGTTGTLNLLIGNGATVATSTSNVTINAWSHVAVSYDAAGNYQFYSNGKPVGTGTNLVAFANVLPMTVGVSYQNIGTYGYFPGKVHHLYIYDRVLTANEILALNVDQLSMFQPVQRRAKRFFLNMLPTGVSASFATTGPTTANNTDLAGAQIATHAGVMSTQVDSTMSLTGRLITHQIGVLDIIENTNTSIFGAQIISSRQSLDGAVRLQQNLSGAQIHPHVGEISAQVEEAHALSGVSSTSDINTMTIEVDMNVQPTRTFTFTGEIDGGVHDTPLLPAITAVLSLNKPAVTAQPALKGVTVASHLNKPTTTLTGTLAGSALHGHVGAMGKLVKVYGISMDSLVVSGIVPLDELGVSLSWSDTKGTSFQNPVVQSLGKTGEFLTSIRWNRLGMARDRVFLVEWSAPVKTSLIGAFLEVDEAAT